MVNPAQGQQTPVPEVPQTKEGGKTSGTPSGRQEQKPEPPETRKEQPSETTIVDVLHDGISRSILTTATWLDSFFGDQRYASEVNKSYVRFRYNVFLEDESGPLLKPDLEVRLVLPQLREKTHLIISGMPKEENEFSAVQSHSATDSLVNTQERNVTAAVHYVSRETAQESFIVRAGLKLHHGSPAIMLGPRYRVLFPLDTWSLRFIEDVVWRSDEGWQSKSTVDLERPLPHDLFFRTSTEWVHTEHVNGYVYTFSCLIRQPLSPQQVLEYEWVNIFQTRPVNDLEEVDLRVIYRKRIWRDWLYFEVMPQYRFPRSRDFEATPGILFRLDMFFGSYT
jgi:hypothetical protein